jgi:WD40 repeat protein
MCCSTISPDGRTLASGSADQTVKLWDVASGQVLRTLTGHADIVFSVAFSADGRTLAAGSSDNKVKLWDLSSGQLLRTLTGHTVR